MSASRLAVIGITTLWTVGCVPGLKLPVSEAPGATPSSYFLLEGNTSGISAVDRQLKADIEAALADRGMFETDPGEADAVVVVHTATPEKHSRDALYQGWGGWVWRIAGTGAMNSNETYKPGALVVDIFDAWTKELVWHGCSTNAMSDHSSNGVTPRAMNNAVTAAFRTLRSGSDQTAWHRAANAGQTTRPDQTMSVIFSPSPALLVRVDGEPRYEDVTGTRLQRIANTAGLIIRDENDIFYFRLGDTWMQAYELTGAWSVTELTPDGADLALRQATRDRGIDLFSSVRVQGPAPVVFVSIRPADLIVTDGNPEFVPIEGTSLLRVRNTSAAVFKEPTDQELYVHVSSGWFRAWTTNGPWQRVPDKELPADLALTMPPGSTH